MTEQRDMREGIVEFLYLLKLLQNILPIYTTYVEFHYKIAIIPFDKLI